MARQELLPGKLGTIAIMPYRTSAGGRPTIIPASDRWSLINPNQRSKRPKFVATDGVIYRGRAYIRLWDRTRRDVGSGTFAIGPRVQVEAWNRDPARLPVLLEQAAQNRLAIADIEDRAKGPAEPQTVAGAARTWLEKVIVPDGNKSPRTTLLYETVVRRHLSGTHALSTPLTRTFARTKLTLLTAGQVEDLLNHIASTSGAGAAKTTKTVLKGIFKRARKDGLMKFDPTLELDPIQRPKRARSGSAVVRDHSRALQWGEAMALIGFACRDPLSRERDVSELIVAMLALGTRIGETLAIRWCDVNLTQQYRPRGKLGSPLPPFTVEVNATIGREPINYELLLTAVDGSKTTLGRGATKTKGSVRQLPLLPPVLAMLLRRARRHEAVAELPVFPAPLSGGFRDPSNTNKHVRDVLDRLCGVFVDESGAIAELDLTWATPHTFRRTLLTWQDQAGVPGSMRAGSAGHASPEITNRLYTATTRSGDRLRAAYSVTFEYQRQTRPGARQE